MANINVFKQFPDCITTRVKLRGILADCFPTEKVKINLILNAYDEGIVDDIKGAKELSSIMFGRWKKIVIDNYGISDENATWVIDYWFSEYGVAVCNKTYSKPMQEKASTQKNIDKKPTPYASGKTPSKAEGFIDLAKMAVGDKVPKNRIEIITSLGAGVNITSLTCSVRKDYERNGHTSMKFTGEYSGSSSKYVLIFLMLYNANNELIGYDDDTKIRKDFNGQGSFSETVYVPSDEYISKAVVRLVYDPTFA